MFLRVCGGPNAFHQSSYGGRRAAEQRQAIAGQRQGPCPVQLRRHVLHDRRYVSASGRFPSEGDVEGTEVIAPGTPHALTSPPASTAVRPRRTASRRTRSSLWATMSKSRWSKSLSRNPVSGTGGGHRRRGRPGIRSATSVGQERRAGTYDDGRPRRRWRRFRGSREFSTVPAGKDEPQDTPNPPVDRLGSSRPRACRRTRHPEALRPAAHPAQLAVFPLDQAPSPRLCPR